MIIKCGKCGTAFKVKDLLIKAKGTYFRCSECRHVFKVFPDTSVKEEERSLKVNPKATADIYHLVDNFENKLKQVLESVRILEEYEKEDAKFGVKRTEDNSDMENSDSNVESFLIEFDNLLRQNDLEAEDYFIKLKDRFTSSEFHEEMNSLAFYINNLDFQNARKHLKKIAHLLNISLEGAMDGGSISEAEDTDR